MVSLASMNLFNVQPDPFPKTEFRNAARKSFFSSGLLAGMALGSDTPSG